MKKSPPPHPFLKTFIIHHKDESCLTFEQWHDTLHPIYKKEAKAMTEIRNNVSYLYASAYYYTGGLWSPCANCRR